MAELPKTIGRFRIESLLGRGAMGVVYKAYDPDIDRPVAIKLVRADLLDDDERADYLKRFHNEARIAGRCIHSNIVSVFDFSVHENNPFLVMEYVDGVNLGRAFQRGSQAAVADVLPIGLQVLEALEYAHLYGIIHRDIKPANILLQTNARVKVTDFGISRLMSSGRLHETMTLGTPSYMAPEQCCGRAVDQRSDLFSLGCVLYELLSGERVFGGRDFTDTAYRLVHEPHTPLAQKRADIPLPLAQIVDRSLAKSPEERFSSAAEMAQALRPFQVSVDTGSAAGQQVGMGTSPSLPLHDRSVLKRTLSFSEDWDGVDSIGLATIERRLARHVGPLARFHVRHALKTARSAEELCDLLATLVPEPTEREDFVHRIRGLEMSRREAGSDAVARPEAKMAPLASMPLADNETVERTVRALAHFTGPIAHKLVKRALVRATTVEQLHRLCAEGLATEREKEDFYRLLDQP